MTPKPTVVLVTDHLAEILDAIHEMTHSEVLVGVPEEKTARSTDPGDPPSPMTNASLAYIHNYGSPAANIPARPFMEPGVEAVQKEIEARMKQTANAAFEGRPGTVRKGLSIVGLLAQNSIRAKITSGPFAPLAPGTIRARKQKRKSRNNTSIKPLIDTGAMRASITYVVRETE